MFIDDLVEMLQQYRASYPHRNIEVRGEMTVDVQLPGTEKEAEPFKLHLGPIDEVKSS